MHVDRPHGNGTAIVLAGGAQPPLDPADSQGRPDVPLTRYRIGLHFARPGAIGQITSWQSLDHAPWDQGTLYVRKDTHVVVAGPAAESGVVLDRERTVAETAAAYDIGPAKTAWTSRTWTGSRASWCSSRAAPRPGTAGSRR